MIDLDDILQKKLADLERGVPLETVLAELPPEASSLAPLIRLASKSRLLAHPQLSPMAARLQQARLVAAVTRQRLAGWLAKLPPLPAWMTTGKAVYALGSLAIVFVFVLLGVSLLALGQGATHTARLIDPSGIVEVATANGDEWHFIQEGENLKEGQSVRTYADSSAVLVFSDGSRTAIGPDSDVTLTDLGSEGGTSIQVKLTQYSGSTTNDVIPLRGSASYFLLDTPAGMATVHGTSFDVEINKAGGTLFGVTHGLVQVKNDLSEVYLASGQSTLVLEGEEPEQPSYQFTLQGVITARPDPGPEGQWAVNSVPFSVTAETDILGDPQVGANVVVKGRILESKEWVADSIQPFDKGKDKARFTGVVQSMTSDEWEIDGHTVLVDKKTELEGTIEVGTTVEVNFVVQKDGSWLATSIEAIEEEEEPEETPTETSTPTPEGETEGEASPTPTETATPTPTPEVSGEVLATPTSEPKNDTQRCENRTEQQPAALKLVEHINASIVTPTGTTGTAEETPKVTYEDIMGWFCKGFGFGEIDLAYDLSAKSGKDVYEIFQMRLSGMGWGVIKKQIMQEMASMAGTTATPKAPGKGKSQGQGQGQGPKK